MDAKSAPSDQSSARLTIRRAIVCPRHNYLYFQVPQAKLQTSETAIDPHANYTVKLPDRQLKMNLVLFSSLSAEPSTILQLESYVDLSLEMQNASGRISGCTRSMYKNEFFTNRDRSTCIDYLRRTFPDECTALLSAVIPVPKGPEGGQQ